MLKYALLIALIPFSAYFAHRAHCNDSADGTAEQVKPRRDVYQKLGITHDDSSAPPEEVKQPEREPAQEQPQQQREDSGNASPPRDTSDHPLNSDSSR